MGLGFRFRRRTKRVTFFPVPFSNPVKQTVALFWDRIYEAGSECQEKKANFSEGAPEELKGVAD